MVRIDYKNLLEFLEKRLKNLSSQWYIYFQIISLKYHSIFLKKNTYLVILQSKKKKKNFLQVSSTNYQSIC